MNTQVMYSKVFKDVFTRKLSPFDMLTAFKTAKVLNKVSKKQRITQKEFRAIKPTNVVAAMDMYNTYVVNPVNIAYILTSIISIATPLIHLFSTPISGVLNKWFGNNVVTVEQLEAWLAEIKVLLQTLKAKK